MKTEEKSGKQRKHAVKKAKDGQVLLDVSRGNIRITATGALVGDTPADSGALNPQGYRITGKTTKYNIVVESKVKTELTFENADISCATTDSLNVSHADVTITLVGKKPPILYKRSEQCPYEGRHGWKSYTEVCKQRTKRAQMRCSLRKYHGTRRRISCGSFGKQHKEPNESKGIRFL